MTQNPVRSNQKPGNSDALNTGNLFPSNNSYGIPDLLPVPLSASPEGLVPYRYKARKSEDRAGQAVHFFVDDYRFESVWHRPGKALQSLSEYKSLLTPDFSLYTDYPAVMQIWNTYRNRWCGCYWQSLGFTVIPSITWSDADSFAFCFAGVPKHSLVAVSTIGIKRKEYARQLFQQGYEAMLLELEPSRVLCYGNPFSYMDRNVELKVYPYYRRKDIANKQKGTLD